MAQSLSKILLHIVFSTKYRKPWIHPQIQPELHAYLATACRNLGCEAFRVGGVEDHVHIACSLPRVLTVSQLLENIKKTSSKWMKSQSLHLSAFAWQSGYGAFSLGESQLKRVVSYIERQAEHHRARSFQEEYLSVLKKYGIEYDEKYLWI